MAGPSSSPPGAPSAPARRWRCCPWNAATPRSPAFGGRISSRDRNPGAHAEAADALWGPERSKRVRVQRVRGPVLPPGQGCHGAGGWGPSPRGGLGRPRWGSRPPFSRWSPRGTLRGTQGLGTWGRGSHLPGPGPPLHPLGHPDLWRGPRPKWAPASRPAWLPRGPAGAGGDTRSREMAARGWGPHSAGSKGRRGAPGQHRAPRSGLCRSRQAPRALSASPGTAGPARNPMARPPPGPAGLVPALLVAANPPQDPGNNIA